MASSSSSSPEISHAAPAFDPSFFTCASLDDVLEELSTRFIMNLPDQELASVERMCFQVEQAHWYYEDFMREANTKLPSLSLKRFSSMFFNSCPLLRQWSADHEQLFDTFMHYKVRVPVCGAIMLNDKWDKCLLVKGWKSSAGWGFPKGKINQLEELHMCAIREVQEETGFDLTKYIRSEDYIEMTIREQSVTLFVVGGIPEDYNFQCRTRKEISKIEWFKVSDLPTWKRNRQVAGKFYLISPFIPPLKEFIRVNRPSKRRQNRRKSSMDTNADLTIHTDFKTEGNEEKVETRQEGQELQHRAVSLDRDAQGYSSSSVDNGDPQTPSPQSSDAYPVATQIDLEHEPAQAIDPHFARLLNGLTLSASKPQLDGQSEPRATSITPTSAKSNIVRPSRSSISKSPAPKLDIEQPPSLRDIASALPNLISSPSSLSVSTRSNSSSMTVRPQSSHPALSGPPMLPPSAARRLKHLALLESVAQESAVSAPSATIAPPVHPGPPSSVPPALFPTEGRHHPHHHVLPSGLMHPTHPPVFVSPPGPPFIDDPFTVRPMTSQAAFPPLSSRQPGLNMNAHQGSLLSILSGPGGHPAYATPVFHAMHSNGNMSRPRAAPFFQADDVPQLPFHQRIQPEASAPQALRVMPPPSNAFQHNPGPLTAPLPPNPSMAPNVNDAQVFKRAHLLSLLNSNSIANPTSTLQADATRTIYPSGSTTISGVSNSIAHR